MGEGGGRDAAVIDGAVVAKDVVHRNGALSRSRVCQHQLSGDVANGPEMRHRLTVDQNAHAVVDGHKAAVGLDVERLQVQAFAAGHTAGGHQHGIHFKRLHQFTAVEVRQIDPHRAARGHLASQNT